MLVDSLRACYNLSVFALLMPLRAVCFTLHNALTKRDYTYQIDDLFDLIIAACVGIWIYTVFVWQNEDPRNPSDEFSRKGTFDHYVFVALEKVNTDFNLMYFLSVMVFVMWGRFVAMLQLTRTFGPMLRIIINMLSDVGKFIFIYFIGLCILASFSGLIFGKLEQFKGFWNVFVIMFDTGFGNYDLLDEAYNEFDGGSAFVQVVIMVAVLFNCILLLNFVIAMLASTYSELTSQSLGLYYDGVIARIPVYEDDLKYGGLIIATPPFNAIAILLAPYFYCVKDEQRLIAVNEAFTKVAFAPIALLACALFAAFSLVMVPFAYLYAVRIKLQNLCSYEQQAEKTRKAAKKGKTSKKRAFDAIGKDLLLFVLLGVPLLLASWFVDVYYFLTHIYRSDIRSYESQLQKEFIMTEEQFEELESFCQDEMKKMIQSNFMNDEADDLVSIKSLIYSLKDRLDVNF